MDYTLTEYKKLVAVKDEALAKRLDKMFSFVPFYVTLGIGGAVSSFLIAAGFLWSSILFIPAMITIPVTITSAFIVLLLHRFKHSKVDDDTLFSVVSVVLYSSNVLEYYGLSSPEGSLFELPRPEELEEGVLVRMVDVEIDGVVKEMSVYLEDDIFVFYDENGKREPVNV